MSVFVRFFYKIKLEVVDLRVYGMVTDVKQDNDDVTVIHNRCYDQYFCTGSLSV